MEQETDETVRCVDADYQEVMLFLSEVDTLEMVRPGEFHMTDDVWVVEADGERVGMALVEIDSNEVSEPDKDISWVHRIGVKDEHQGEGYGRELLEAIHKAYSPIELEIRVQKDANDFYKHLGMDLVSQRYAVFEEEEGTLNVWRWD